MANPKHTGVSGITGKIVTIRHAAGLDRFRVLQELRKQGRSEELPEGAQLVVAAEEDRIIGFGIFDITGAPEGVEPVARFTLYEDTKRRGIGAQIIKHLEEHAPVRIQ